jgi:FixJ family two-component response regulator
MRWSPHCGSRLLGPKVPHELRGRSRTRVTGSATRARHHRASLTPREREIMALVVSGRPNKQIAAELGISEITVKAHRGRVMRKMQVESLAHLVRVAAALDGSARRSG